MHPFIGLWWWWCIVVVVIGASVGTFDDDDEETAIKYLRKYGYLNTDTLSMSPENAKQTVRHAVGLFQEYYRLPGQGELNDLTLKQMHKPRCGLADLTNDQRIVWPKKHLTWNFHLADKETLTVAQAAFDLWAANSSLSFKRVALMPDILISYREGFHMNIDKQNGEMCMSPLDGPGGVLAHAAFPNGHANYVAEVHVDTEEPWYIPIDKNPPKTFSLLYVIAHEIGHALGLQHSERKDSIMYAYASNEPNFPISLNLDDILKIQYLYGTTTTNNFTTTESPSTTITTTTTTTTTLATPSTNVDRDPCALRDPPDVVLITGDRLYIAHERYIWPIDIKENTYESKPIVVSDYLRFLPNNFTRLTAAYQKPTGDLVIFVDDIVYVASFPSYELIQKLSFKDFGLPSKAKINTAINTNKGQSFVIYNDHIVGEIDDCTTRVMTHRSINEIFPGIPPGAKTAFRYIDGNLYFVKDRIYYRFNDFIKLVTKTDKFDLRIVGIVCPRDSLLKQMRDLLGRLIQIDSFATTK